MKNKVLKKALAAALALTLVSGAPAAVRGGKGIFPPAITANAVTKNIEIGETFADGDTIDFGEGSYIAKITSENSENIEKIFLSGEQLVDYGRYDAYNAPYHYVFKLGNEVLTFEIEYFGKGVSLIVTDGDGTEEHPYVFDVVMPETYTKVDLTSVNVALDDSIALKYYAIKKSVDDTNVASVMLDGPNGVLDLAKTAFKTVTINEIEYYVFEYPIFAPQYRDDVTIKFLGDDNASIGIYDQKNDWYAYALKDYWQYVYMYDSKTLSAIRALQSLCVASRNYLNNGTWTGSFRDKTDDVKNDLTGFAANFTSDEAKISLVLDSKLAVRLYIEGLEAGAKSDDSKYTAVAGLDGKACFEVKALSPLDLGKQYDIEYNGKTYSFSALSYCARAINNTTIPQASLFAQAVYEYYKYVKRYADPTLKLVKIDTGKTDGIHSFYYNEGETWADLVEREDSLYYHNGYIKMKCYESEHVYYLIVNGAQIDAVIDENYTANIMTGI